MWRRTLSIALASLAIAACGGTGGGAAPNTTAAPSSEPSEALPTATTTPQQPSASDVVVVDGPPPVATPAPATEPVAASSSATVIGVDADSLPREVTNAIRIGGGELATTAAWVQRFAPKDLPLLDGPGVHLIEADVEATRTSGGHRRVDAMQWLFVDAAGVADTLDELAASIDVAGWERVDDSAVIDAAPCVTRTYTTSASDESWILQGCDFPAFPGMKSVGVTHSNTAAGPITAPTIDASVALVVEDIRGTVEHVIARFGSPETVDSTATLTTAVTLTPGTAEPAGMLADTSLAGWTASPGEANSTVFLGVPGQAWTVTPTTVRYSSQGRLEP